MMSNTRLHVILRPMTVADVEQVAELDRLSFSNPWPVRTYHYELRNRERSFLFVLQPDPPPAQPQPVREPEGWLRRILQPATKALKVTTAPLIGYSGFWQVADEAHISTIAVHPDWRGNKLGELLLWNMIRHAIRQRACKVTLEVRVSNKLAQNLYYKYGFEIVGRRKGYYSDNGEDAYNMLLTPLDEAYRRRMIAFGRALAQRLHVTDLTVGDT